MKAKYFKIETFGTLDGPGIRLIIFLYGCNFRCIYCHNPESWTKTDLVKKISIKEIIKIYKKNKEFYKKDGGITISGGEPMLQIIFILKLAKACKRNKIHLTIDTSASNFNLDTIKLYNKIIKYVNLWIIDIKHMNEIGHYKITGKKETAGINFINYLENKKINYWVRYVLLNGYTGDKEILNQLKEYISNLKYLSKFEFLPFHNMAKSKYENLNLEYKLKDL